MRLSHWTDGHEIYYEDSTKPGERWDDTYILLKVRMNHVNEIASIVYVNVKAILSEVGVKKLCCIVFQTSDAKTENFVIDLKKSQNANSRR